MTRDARKIVIIGAGIAGLCAAVYARRGGDYMFETCLHWLLGSNPDRAMHAQWRELFDIDKLTFVQPEEYVRLETEHGESLSIYSNVDRLEAELLAKAPQTPRRSPVSPRLCAG
jgi:phytoene dehydrogenase-like protein